MSAPSSQDPTPRGSFTERFEEVVRENQKLRDALVAFQLDPHRPSARGCATCKAITATLGHPFGCALIWAEQEGR